jgi:hypothetical protein
MKFKYAVDMGALTDWKVRSTIYNKLSLFIVIKITDQLGSYVPLYKLFEDQIHLRSITSAMLLHINKTD